MINVGPGNISDIKVGSDGAIKAYQGNELVWTAEEPVYTALTCVYYVDAPGVTTIGNGITSATQTMIVDGVEVSASTTYNFTSAGKHVVEWGIVDTLPFYAFSGVTALTTVYFPPSTLSMRQAAFYGCTNLTTADLSGTQLWDMGAATWSGCTSLKEIKPGPLGGGRIFADTWNGCTNVTALTIPTSIYQILDRAFYEVGKNGPGLPRLEIPGNVKTINQYAFSRIKVQRQNTYNVVLGEGVETIANNAFENASTSMGGLIIPSSVTSIGDYACASMDLEVVKFLGSTPPSIGDNAFFDQSSSFYVEVPSGSASSYEPYFPGVEIVEY